jgi:hypothetical protein
MTMRPVSVIILVLLAACADFPALEGTIEPAALTAPYPALVPLGPILAQAR